MAKDKKINFKMDADTRQAERAIERYKRKVDTLGKVSTQGSDRQSGFLSEKQVELYKSISREMEQIYQQHYSKLSQIEKQYADKIKQTQSEISRRQQQYSSAQDRGASPSVQEFYRSKLSEAKSKASSDEFSQLNAKIAALTNQLKKLDSERSKGEQYSKQIGQMHQMNPAIRKMAGGTTHLLGQTGMITSIAGLTHYTMSGIDLLRQERMNSIPVAMKATGYRGDDNRARTDLYTQAMKYQYSQGATAQVANTLLAGGDTNRSSLLSDTGASMKFGRAFALDPTALSGSGAMLQRMGALSEGQMQKFADLIGGSVAKEGMGGREGELLQSTTQLAQSVSQGLDKLTTKQLGNIVGLQTALGTDVPSLKGQRGAQVLSSMDSSIKNGGSSMDILLGKGTKYVGPKGMIDLQRAKEEGIGNPKNLQTIIQNANKMISNPYTREAVLTQNLGLTVHQYEAMQKSGFFNQIAKGKMPTPAELRKYGSSKLADQVEKWNQSHSKSAQSNNVWANKLKADSAKPAESIATNSRSAFHSLPEWMQVGGVWGAGLGMGLFGHTVNKFGKKVLLSGAKKIFPNIEGQGGILGNTYRWLNRGGGGGPTPPEGGGGGMMSGIRNFLSREGSSAGGGLLESAGIGALKIGAKSLPIIGGTVTAGLDHIQNPKHSWGRSIARGAGSAIGGVLGAGAAIASGFFSGGLGWLGTGAAAIGGSWAGEHLGDNIYSMFAGTGDLKKATAGKKVPVSTTSTSSSAIPTINSLNVAKLNVQQDTSGTSYKSKSGSNSDTKTIHLKVDVSGNITNMDKKNQGKVTTSVVDGISKFFNNSGIDISNDYMRGVLG